MTNPSKGEMLPEFYDEFEVGQHHILKNPSFVSSSDLSRKLSTLALSWLWLPPPPLSASSDGFGVIGGEVREASNDPLLYLNSRPPTLSYGFGPIDGNVREENNNYTLDEVLDVVINLGRKSDITTSLNKLNYIFRRQQFPQPSSRHFFWCLSRLGIPC